MGDSKKTDRVGEQRNYNEGGITGKGFTKGRSGNPSGRPKGAVSLSGALKKIITHAQAESIVKQLLEIAAKKPVRRKVYGCGCKLHNKDGGRYETYDSAEIRLYEFAVGTILERIDGKATQPIANDSDSPVTFVINTNLPGFVNGKHKRSQNS